MKRYSKEKLAKHPHLKGKDIETTKKACQRFKHNPVTIASFAEATRYTKAKAKKQNSPYKHLLKPRAGGLAYSMMAMDEHLNEMINITIVYPENNSLLKYYMNGRLKRAIIHIETFPITNDLRGDYMNDREFRIRFQTWLNELWAEKDKKIDEILEQDRIKRGL